MAVRQVPSLGQGVKVDRQAKAPEALGLLRGCPLTRKDTTATSFFDNFLAIPARETRRFTNDFAFAILSATRLSPRTKAISSVCSETLDTWPCEPIERSPTRTHSFSSRASTAGDDPSINSLYRSAARCDVTSAMGNSVSWLSGLLWAKKEIRILILGLVCATLERPIAGGG